MTYFAKLCIEGLRYNKVRSFLTGLGVLVGVGSVVLILALTTSLSAHLGNQSTDRFTVGLSSSAEANADVVAALATAPMSARVEAVRLRPDVSAVEVETPGRTLSVTSPDGSTMADLRCAFDDNVEVVEGRPFSEATGNVAIMYANPEFRESTQVGSVIGIDGAAFTVIGLTQNLGPDGSTRLFLPQRAAEHVQLTEAQASSSFTVIVRQPEDLAETRADVLAQLNDGIDASLKFVDFSAEEGAMLEEMFQTLGLFLGLIASISLAVAALNIVNVMYISTLERADEIAIYRSLGMTRNHVRGLFLMESLVVVTTFALVGCVVGYLIAAVILTLVKVPLAFGWTTIGLLLLVVLLVGAGGGLYPANKAAGIDPVRLLH
ncbi:MAG: ABC transporter permease [Micropruina sp.]|nr:ABC transporter permease [Micropruina sp.]